MKTKTCPRCGVDKCHSEFSVSKSRKNNIGSLCRSCAREYGKEHYEKNKEQYKKRIKEHKKFIISFLIRYKKTIKCVKCQETRWYVIDFHHLYGKSENIAKLARDCGSAKRLKEEIRKCIPLCANCHRELHHIERIGELR